jgi:isoleucyl-tRNA synthetase
MLRLGADTLRYYLLSSPVLQGEQLNFSEKDCETLQRTLFGTLWNVRAFYLLYAGGQNIELTKPKSAHILDRWLLSRLMQTVRQISQAMESYDLVSATRPLRTWIDDLSTWWLRRSRERMKGDNAYEKLDALRTLREALLDTSLLFAPFTPFFADKLYQDVNGSKMSVHLDKWPKADERLLDEQLLADMSWLREVAAAAHEVRSRSKIPVRQALASLTVSLSDATEASRLASRSDLMQLLREELNVEKIVLNGGVETGDEPWLVELDTVITPELKKKGLARELSRRVMDLRKRLGLTPEDRILVAVAVADRGLADTVESFSSLLAKDVRAASVAVTASLTEGQEIQDEFTLDGTTVKIGINRA